ncbi:DinB family protein [Salipaludibacillus daqingensis]|uniref:DinB family protein n=1 Tax=Salipaludibacillus daqingensis TaxID=3041001 RepID=UPI002473B7E5|nr:DinB family protein [Salipaludibacillus daqingensis]
MSQSSHIKDRFLSHRLITNDLIGKIKTEHFDYKPTPTSMSAHELVVHMLTSFYHLASAAAKQRPKTLHDKDDDKNLPLLAQRYTDESVKLIESLSEERLDEFVDLSDSMGINVPARTLIDMAIDHEINHKGNLFVYVREMGHEKLPMFVKK